jgi:tRNA-Thr(GGU) m(6)t(6)A37 methyltransferase TsaA
VLTLKAELPKDILSGLEQYSHCWLIYVFHQNTDLHQDWKKIKGKVNVPRLNGGRVGVLATRSPHRPNAIGLSSAKIDGISSNGKVLELSGVDLVDESPILDIKPYVPFCDSLSCAETPEWVRRDRDEGLEPLHIAEVSISDEVKEKLEACWLSNNEEEKRRSRNREIRNNKAPRKNNGRQEVVVLYKTFADFLSLVRQVLARDIRSLHQRTKDKGDQRGKRSNERSNTASVVNHLHLLGKIDVSYLQSEREIRVTDAQLL